MVLSSLYHTFECHSSVEVSRACFALDILGITLGLMATYLSGIYYAFWCEPGWRDFYLCTVGGIFLLATSTHFAPGKAVIDLLCTQLGGGGRSNACRGHGSACVCIVAFKSLRSILSSPFGKKTQLVQGRQEAPLYDILISSLPGQIRMLRTRGTRNYITT